MLCSYHKISNKEGRGKLLEVMDMFIILIVVSWVHTFAQNHQIVFIKYVQYFVNQLYLKTF